MTADTSKNNKGLFQKGRSGNPAGRPKKAAGVDAAILNAMQEKVTVSQNGKRKRVKKLEATAAQIANKGAAGDLRAAKMVLDYAHQAQDRLDNGAAKGAVMTASDHEIAARVLERMARIITNSPKADFSVHDPKPEEGTDEL